VISSHQTIALPTVGEVEDGAKSVLAISALVGGVWAAVAKWRKRRAALEAKRALEARAIRYLVDAQHHVLRLLNMGRLPENEIQRQEFLIKELRKDLAKLDGHEDLLAVADTQEQVMRFLTRTQRIYEKKAQIRASHEEPGE